MKKMYLQTNEPPEEGPHPSERGGGQPTHSNPSDFLGFLKDVLLREKRYVINELMEELTVYDAEVVDVTRNVVDLRLSVPNVFEVGDVVGVVQGLNVVQVLGNVLESIDHYVSVYSPKEVLEGLKPEVGSRIRVFDAEALQSIDLQMRLIDLIESGQLRSPAVDLFFDESYRQPDLEVRFELKDVKAVGEEIALDEYQVRAVEAALSLSDGEVLLVIGPPGTGKTRVVRKIAYMLSNRGEKVLITSHANIAVDNAVEGLPVDSCLRVGRPEKILPHIHPYMLSYKAKTALGEALELIERRIEELRRKYAELVRWLDYLSIRSEKQLRYEGMKLKTMEELRLTKSLITDLIKERRELINEKIMELVEKTPIIASTLIKSQLKPLENVNFDTVVIDESSQASLTLALLAMVKGRKWVLIGDHKQLLPIFKSVKDLRVQESLSAFVNLLKKYPNRALWLKIHYRSNSEIIDFPAKYIYEGNIRASPTCRELRLKLVKKPKYEFLNPDKPVVFIDVDGREERVGRSLVNEAEAHVVVEILKELLECGVKPEEVGVITPYKAQRNYLRKLINVRDIEIKTVDGFQGREKDVIVFSLTAMEDFKFVSNPNRLNVALTRPKYKLIVVGNARALSRFKWSLAGQFLTYVFERGRVYAWPPSSNP
ncbi:MAG: hypothetical protein B7O98_04295 [Zestosphaera tikiterensis]|uniref:AAA+ ATPase domain-containing protein n=1 Tax=Zestosphaera tikiterensis TaxID=1973259 RepID=A0A2R7Y8K1_9CREN|nr:MAG: hypothetical protein B7O98_04295 [Zestosphaera tikiterensis]